MTLIELLRSQPTLPEFALVYSVSECGVPVISIHSTYTAARDHAERMAKEHPGHRFFPLRSDGSFVEAQITPKTTVGTVSGDLGQIMAKLGEQSVLTAARADKRD